MTDKTFLIFLLLIFIGVGVAEFSYRTYLKPKNDDLKNSKETSLVPGPIQTRTLLPDFVLPGLDGKLQASSQWADKIVILNFWATWCPPCREEIPAFIALQKELGPKGIQFIGIALDQPEAVRDFVQQIGVNYPVLLGDEGLALMLAQQLGDRQMFLPFSVIFDRIGQVVYRSLGELTPDTIRTQIGPLL